MKCEVSNRVYVADAFPTDLLSTTRAKGYTPPSLKFRAGILRTKKGTVLIYPNGRAVINKCRSSKDLRKTVRYCFLTIGIGLSSYRLVNVVGYGKLNQRLNLYDLAKATPKSIYEPELHCGLLFYVGKVSVIVYHTGVIIFCGCKSKAEFRYIEGHLSRKFINRAVPVSQA